MMKWKGSAGRLAPLRYETAFGPLHSSTTSGARWGFSTPTGILAEVRKHSGRTTFRVRIDQFGSQLVSVLGRAARAAPLWNRVWPGGVI